ncbi:glycosyltransferase [Bacteroidales bacterium OttesenSCG-928-M06]|nr:glycosyltransferase [Bacteroidales bacterium OttesenSCG-928-M06]
MKVSIIIPVYNVSAFIERCLISALNQTYQDIEYILVDDVGQDNSMEIANSVITGYPDKDVKVIQHTTNKGLGGARNTGVKASSGEYIFFLDSDDELSSDCIEILALLTKEKSIDLIIGEIDVVGNKRKAYPLLTIEDGIYHGNDFILNSFLQKKWYEMAWNKLIKRSLFIEKGIWFTEGILHEDTLWSFQLALELQSMAVIHAKTYHYHIQKGSITQKKSNKNIEDFYFLLKKIIESSKGHKIFQTYPSVYFYLERLRIFFIKSLAKGNFSKEFILKQKKQLDDLYNSEVWTNKPQSFTSKCKEIILSLLFSKKLR